MNTIKSFVKYYQARKKRQKIDKEEPLDYGLDNYMKIELRDMTDPRVTFQLRATEHHGMGMIIIPNHGFPTITLDDEDLQVLYEKYAPKLESEMEANIQQIKKDYEL